MDGSYTGEQLRAMGINPDIVGQVQYVNGQPVTLANDNGMRRIVSGGSNSFSSDLTGSVNKYVDSLLSQSQGQLDLALKKLDTEHKLALGNNDAEQAKFLETVADGLEQKIGRIPYDYQRYNDRELKQYAMGQNNISSNKDLALKRLAEDERNLNEQAGQQKQKLGIDQQQLGLQRQQLGMQQGVDNQAMAEDLNQRGLLYGQRPVGMGQATGLTGLNGVAGSLANKQNLSYNSKNQGLDLQGAGLDLQGNIINQNLASGLRGVGLDTQGVNLDALQKTNALDFQHGNTMQDLTTSSRRDAQDQANSYAFGTQAAKQQFEQQRQALERMRDSLTRQAQLQSSTLAGKQAGILGY